MSLSSFFRRASHRAPSTQRRASALSTTLRSQSTSPPTPSSSSTALPKKASVPPRERLVSSTLVRALPSTLALIAGSSALGAFLAFRYAQEEDPGSHELATVADVLTGNAPPAAVNVTDNVPLAERDVTRELIELTPITDEIFDNSDNLLVVVVGSEAWLQDPKFKMSCKALVEKVKGEFGKVKAYFTVQEGLGDTVEEGAVKFMVEKH